MVMRRDQIHKLVLNHAIGSNFTFTASNKNVRSFNWGALNFAESVDGALESLAVRFRTDNMAQKFQIALSNAIKDCKMREAKDDEQQQTEEDITSATTTTTEDGDKDTNA